MAAPICLAYPMHGQFKLSNEGYRTRDGHIIEWLGRFASSHDAHIDVVSRPEPWLLAPKRRIRGAVTDGTDPVSSWTWRVPRSDAQHWWVRSAAAYPRVSAWPVETPAVSWNPFTAVTPPDRNPFSGGRTVILDLLDDWTVHQAFAPIRGAVERAYAGAFEASAAVFANSEGTLDLAHRFGRSDATLMVNGVDPERFESSSAPSGRLTIGYVGKIGRRLNASLLTDVISSFPDFRFVFAGPIFDAEYSTLLAGFRNVQLLGDIHYDEVPALMSTFDLGWVPHAVGHGEVGGDVIKTYEYRATGLQVLTTPVIGAGRQLSEAVHIVPATEQAEWIRSAAVGRSRLDRFPASIPSDLTWEYKARQIAATLGMNSSSWPL